MKKLAIVFMAVVLFDTMPVLAADHANMKMDEEGMRECALQAESLQQKITRIQGEIKKGSNKYSAAELKKMNEKLKEANKALDAIVKN